MSKQTFAIMASILQFAACAGEVAPSVSDGGSSGDTGSLCLEYGSQCEKDADCCAIEVGPGIDPAMGIVPCLGNICRLPPG